MISNEFEVLELELDLSKCFASKRNSSSGSESCSWSGIADTAGVRESGPEELPKASNCAGENINSLSGVASAGGDGEGFES